MWDYFLSHMIFSVQGDSTHRSSSWITIKLVMIEISFKSQWIAYFKVRFSKIFGFYTAQKNCTQPNFILYMKHPKCYYNF